MTHILFLLILISRCQQCSEGQYSFEDGMKATGCKKCPTDADLCYGAVIQVKKGICFTFILFIFNSGFWRKTLISDKPIKKSTTNEKI